MKARTHWRNIVFPAPLSLTRWKFGIAFLDFLLEMNSHLCHHLEILHDGASDSIGDGITVDELAHHFGTIGYEVLTSLGRRYARVYKGDTGEG